MAPSVRCDSIRCGRGTGPGAEAITLGKALLIPAGELDYLWARIACPEGGFGRAIDAVFAFAIEPADALFHISLSAIDQKENDAARLTDASAVIRDNDEFRLPEQCIIDCYGTRTRVGTIRTRADCPSIASGELEVGLRVFGRRGVSVRISLDTVGFSWGSGPPRIAASRKSLERRALNALQLAETRPRPTNAESRRIARTSEQRREESARRSEELRRFGLSLGFADEATAGEEKSGSRGEPDEGEA